MPSPSLTPPVHRSLSELSLAWTSVSEVTWGESDNITVTRALNMTHLLHSDPPHLHLRQQRADQAAQQQSDS